MAISMPQLASFLRANTQDDLRQAGLGVGMQAAQAMGGAGLGAAAAGGPPAMGAAAAGAGADIGTQAAGEALSGMSPTAKAGLLGLLASGLGALGSAEPVRSRVPIPRTPEPRELLAMYRPY